MSVVYTAGYAILKDSKVTETINWSDLPSTIKNVANLQIALAGENAIYYLSEAVLGHFFDLP